MTLMVKFGQNVIMKENLHNVSEEIRKNMWTDNKIYRNTGVTEIRPTFDVRKGKDDNNEAVKQLMMKSKSNREILEKIGNVYFSRDVGSDDVKSFQDFKKDLIHDYFDDRILSKKRNLATLTHTLADVVDNTDKEQLANTNLKEISDFKNSKLLDLIKKYKTTLLINSDYKVLINTDKLHLLRYLENEEKKRKGVTDINDICYDLTKVNLNKNPNQQKYGGLNYNYNDLGFSLFVDNNLGQDNFSQNMKDNLNIKRGDSDLLVSRLVLFEEFRNYVNNRKLTDDQILFYFRQNEDINKAAELYFIELYGTNKLKLTYIFPDKSQHKAEFDLTASPEELFMFIYSQKPEANDPKLYKIDSTQIVFDPIKDKFIGGLCLPQNTILNVKF